MYVYIIVWKRRIWNMLYTYNLYWIKKGSTKSQMIGIQESLKKTWKRWKMGRHFAAIKRTSNIMQGN